MPALGRLSHVVVDCADADRLAAFWAAVLDVEVGGRWKQYVLLKAPGGGGPALAFQEVPEPKAGKNRVHLDLTVDDLDAATTAALALGATVVGEASEDGVTARVLADPEGNELCLVHGGG